MYLIFIFTYIYTRMHILIYMYINIQRYSNVGGEPGRKRKAWQGLMVEPHRQLLPYATESFLMSENKLSLATKNRYIQNTAA